MEEVIPANRANRDFRVKFPDDVLQESLAGQLWFGAEVDYLISHEKSTMFSIIILVFISKKKNIYA